MIKLAFLECFFKLFYESVYFTDCVYAHMFALICVGPGG